MTATSWPGGAGFVEKITSVYGWVPDSHEHEQKMSEGFAGLNDTSRGTCIFALAAPFLHYDSGG